MNELAGRTALVTGASKGIGLEVGRVLATAGAKVMLCARDAAVLEAAAAGLREETGGDVVAVPGDLSTAEGVNAVAAAVEAAAGGVDILVNNAGAAPPGTIDVLTDEQWDVAINLKFRGYIRLIRAFLPGMVSRGFGRIVNVAGNAGKQPDGWIISSGTVNAAVMALTKAVGTSVAASGVTCNAVCPGPTATDRWTGMQKAYSSLHGVEESSAEQAILANIPAGRVATVQDVAYAVRFFALPQAGHITGESLMVDGGHVAAV